MRRRINNSDVIDGEDKPFIMNMNKSGIPTAEDVIALSPAFHGSCYKKNNSFLAWIFPCIYPEWKERYLILIGAYIYRFSSEIGDLKGVPIPVESTTVTLSEQNDTFALETLRKKYVIRVTSTEDRTKWVDAIKTRKHMAIKERLGHAPLDPEIKKMNSLGDKLFNKRILSERKDAERENDAVQNPMMG